MHIIDFHIEDIYINLNITAGLFGVEEITKLISIMLDNI